MPSLSRDVRCLGGRLAGGRLRVWVVLGVAAALAALPGGVAGAQSPAQLQYESEPSSAEAAASRVPELEARVGEQAAALEQGIGEISAVGAELEEAQSRVDGARVRAEELREQTQSLQRQIRSQREAFW